METLVDKAWELHRLTAHFPGETILQATQWLEARQRKTPGDKLAIAIALHYLLLALREDIALDSRHAKEHYAQAARWQVVAWVHERAVSQPKSLGDRE